MNTTPYYDEFKYYFKLAKDQQDKLDKQKRETGLYRGTTLRERQAAERVEQFQQVYELLKTREAPKGTLHTSEFRDS